MKSPYDPPEELPIAAPMKHRPSPSILVLIISMVAFSVIWRLVTESNLRASGLLYIGVPASLALLLALSPSPGSATGMKGMTLFLLLVGILMIEGIICILMAAPLFYLVGAIIGALIDYFRLRQKSRMNCSAGGVILLFTFEGVTDTLSFDRNEIVTIHHETTMSLDETRQALGAGPEFDLTELPLFLKAGFPTPQRIEGNGVAENTQWTVGFQGPKGIDNLVVEVTEASERRLVFTCIENDTKIGEWMEIEKVVWDLEPTAEGTRVAMTFHYRRLLDPAWYFKPLQRYGVSQAGAYFMEQIFKQDAEVLAD